MVESTGGNEFLYDAFVSYSHSADRELAPVLQSHLQRFAKPWWRLRSTRVFRDDTTLNLTPHLWPDIRAALDASRYFVLLASPEAAASRWVQQEISHWLSTKGAGSLLIVQTEGRIAWDTAARDFDWRITDALPKILTRAYPDEPKWEDVSILTSAKDLSLRNPVLQRCVASLYSAITGRPLDEVIGDDVRQHRRTRLVATGAATALLLTIAAAFWSWQATERERERGQQIAISQVEARSRFLAERALEEIRDGDAATGINMVLEDRDIADAYTGIRRAVVEGHYALQSGLINNYEKSILAIAAEVRTLDVAADGRHIAVGADKEVQVFDLATGARRARLPHDGLIMTAVFDAAGNRILSASRDGKARLWDWQTSSLVHTLVHRDAVMTAVFDAGETRIATGSNDRDLAVWDTATGRQLTIMTHGGDVNDLAWSRDARRLFTASHDGTASVWDATSGSLLAAAPARAGRPLPQRHVHLSPDGERALTVPSRQQPGYAILWDATPASTGAIAAPQTGASPAAPTPQSRVIKLLAHGGSSIWSGDFSPDGTLIVTTGSDSRVAVWEARTGEKLYDIADNHDIVVGATFSPDSSRLLTWSRDRSIRVYAACDGRPIGVLQGHTQDVGVARFGADSCTVVSGGGDSTVRVWSLLEPSGQLRLGVPRCLPANGRTNEGRCRQGASAELFARRALQTSALSADGTLAATGSNDMTARIYDTATGALLKELPTQSQPITSIAFANDGSTLLTGQGSPNAPTEAGRVALWDWRGARELKARPEPSFVRTIAFSPDRKRLVTAGGDGVARIYDAASLELLARLEGHTQSLGSANWSPDGTRIVTASFDYRACVWKVDALVTGAVLKQTERCVLHDHRVYSAVFTASGAQILTASGDKMAKIWDVASGKNVRTFYGRDHDFRAARLIARDTLMLTTSNDFTVRLWDVPRGRDVAELRYREGLINTIALDPSESRLLTTATDGTARIWRLFPPSATADLAEAAGREVRRCLSPLQRDALRGAFAIERPGARAWCKGKIDGEAPDAAPRPPATAAEAPPTETPAAAVPR